MNRFPKITKLLAIFGGNISGVAKFVKPSQQTMKRVKALGYTK